MIPHSEGGTNQKSFVDNGENDDDTDDDDDDDRLKYSNYEERTR